MDKSKCEFPIHRLRQGYSACTFLAEWQIDSEVSVLLSCSNHLATMIYHMMDDEHVIEVLVHTLNVPTT